MVRLLVLILFCLSIYVPTASAELYQNRDYNFQMNIPDNWDSAEFKLTKFDGEGKLLLERGIKVGEGKDIRLFMFKSVISPDSIMPSGVTFSNATPAQKKDMLDEWVPAFKESHPSILVTYSDFVQIGRHNAAFIRFTYTDSPMYGGMVLFLSNRTGYLWEYVAYDPTGQYEQQFFDMLKTLRPIVGDSDGDFEEEIMYMHDIAEKEAISQITGESVTIIK